MESIWFDSALWVGLALVSALISIRIGISVALVEIVVGAFGGNLLSMAPVDWINYLAAVGAVLLTFMAGTELEPSVIRRHLRSTLTIGAVGFFAPYLGVLAYAHFWLGWPWPQAQIAGIALSTTSVAVVYAVMVETGYNRTEIGKVILAGCFVNDVGTVLALGIVFANYNLWLATFALATALAMWLMPKFMPAFSDRFGGRVSDAEAKIIMVVLFGLGWMASMAHSEAVLPAYLIGMMLASYFVRERELARRLRTITFTLLTPFYFLRAGSFVKFDTVASAAGLIGVFLAVKMVTKVAGILPLTYLFKFERTEGFYTTLMMSTGLTFGSISALFGLTNGIIDQDQYTVLVTAVIASAVVPTLIAQRWFQPEFKELDTEEAHVQENPGRQ